MYSVHFSMIPVIKKKHRSPFFPSDLFCILFFTGAVFRMIQKRKKWNILLSGIDACSVQTHGAAHNFMYRYFLIININKYF